MIATPKARIENDLYPTPTRLGEVLLKHVAIEGNVFECCAGPHQLSSLFRDCWTNDIDREHKQNFYLDAADPESWGFIKHEAFIAGREIDWVITNPPFNVAPKILPYALENARRGVAFLLRLSYLEPTGSRALFLKKWADQQTHLIPVSPRPQFRADTRGSDSVTCAWFVWDKAHSWERLGVKSPFVYETDWR